MSLLSLLTAGTALIVWVFAAPAVAKTVHYDLTATRGTVNMSGNQDVDWALMINGSIPAPTLEFTEGDDAEIVVKNGLDEEVSIHWHGILLPPEMDGVAYVNTPPIMAGQSHTFRFKIRQHGTYWYHSHTRLQEQKGIYGAIVIHPRDRKIAYDRDLVVVISDWSDEDADQIVKNLRKDGDYYLYKKNSMRSWLGALEAGSLGNYLANEWTRMGGMDLSDVGYDAFLVNGKRETKVSAKPGEKLRIRLINAAASSYFYVSLGQGPLRVVAADGVDVAPSDAGELLIGMAETYDLIYEVPEGKSAELRATVQDVTGYASLWIGDGERVPAKTKPMPDLYGTMDHGAHAGMDHSKMGDGADAGMDHSKMGHGADAAMDHSKMDHAAMGHAMPATPAVETLTVDELRAPAPTAFPADAPVHDVKLVLGGDMERYVWHINGKAIHEDRNLEVKENDVVRFTFVNETMMHHPMHLHGHFFRVVTAAGDVSPMKHTVDVPPHGTRVIEFKANEPGEWMLHCHNLYHMKNGMARVVKYTSFKPKPEVAAHQAHDPHLHDHLYFDGMVEASTNHAQLGLRLSRTWDTLELNVETRELDRDEVEGDLFYRRWFSNFFNVIVGASRFPEHAETPNRGVVGVGYMLPMLIEANFLIDHTGRPRVDLEKRFQWTSTVFTDFDVAFRQGAKTEFEASLMYGPAWSWAAGLMVTEDDVGVGAQYRF